MLSVFPLASWLLVAFGDMDYVLFRKCVNSTLVGQHTLVVWELLLFSYMIVLYFHLKCFLDKPVLKKGIFLVQMKEKKRNKAMRTT